MGSFRTSQDYLTKVSIDTGCKIMKEDVVCPYGVQKKEYINKYRICLIRRVFKLLFLSFLYFIIQCISKLNNEVFFGLKCNKYYSRKLNESVKEEMDLLGVCGNTYVVDTWASERLKWRKGNCKIREKAREEWENECLKNGINDTEWIYKTWFNWVFKFTDLILNRMGEDHTDFIYFLSTCPSYSSVNTYIAKMKKSLESYHKLIINNWEIYMNDSIKKWKEQNKSSIEKEKQ